MGTGRAIRDLLIVVVVFSVVTIISSGLFSPAQGAGQSDPRPVFPGAGAGCLVWIWLLRRRQQLDLEGKTLLGDSDYRKMRKNEDEDRYK